MWRKILIYLSLISNAKVKTLLISIASTFIVVYSFPFFFAIYFHFLSRFKRYIWIFYVVDWEQSILDISSLTINWKITNFIHCFPFLREPVILHLHWENNVFGIEKMLLIIIFAADLCYQQWNTIIPQHLIAKSHMGYRIGSINAKNINLLF